MHRLNSIIKMIETKADTRGEDEALLRAVKGLKKALNRNDLKRAKEKVDEIARYFLDA